MFRPPPILDGKYFKIVPSSEEDLAGKVAAECQICPPGTIVMGYYKASSNFLTHLKVSFFFKPFFNIFFLT